MMPTRALTVLLVLAAPVALMGVWTTTNLLTDLFGGRPVGDYFSPGVPMNSVPLAVLPAWLATIVTLALRPRTTARTKTAPSPAGTALSIILATVLAAGLLFLVALALVMYLWTTTM